jgi:hypothetical protein
MRSAGVCAASGRAFSAGERFIAALVEREGSEDLERQDFSVEAWGEGARPKAPCVLFAFWSSRYEVSEKKSTMLLGDEELVDLFAQLEGAEASKQQAFRYVLALHLMRRKLLVYEGMREGRLVVRERKPVGSGPDGPVMPERLVVDPGMDKDAIAAAVEQLAELMPPQ